MVSRFHYFHFNHICHFLDSSYLIKIVVSLPILSLYWSSKGVHQKEKRSVITDQIPSVQAKLHWIFAWVRFEPSLYNVDVFRKWTFCTLKSRFNTQKTKECSWIQLRTVHLNFKEGQALFCFSYDAPPSNSFGV